MIWLNNIVVKFGDFTALHDINVQVKEGEFFTFLGPSGCGKTTTLRTITGFIEPAEGQVFVRDKDITHVPMNATEQMWYEETGMTIMAFASQGKGFFAQYQAGGAYKPTVKAYYTSIPENLRRAGRCVEVGEKYGVSATVIALAYLLRHPLHPAAMCTYSKISQYEDSMRALEIPLTAAEVRYLETGK